MATKSVTVELPEELVAFLGSPEKTNERVRKSLVLELLREGEISQGKAAELLGVSKSAVLEVMKEHNIYSGPRTSDEISQEIESARRLAREL
ncbi:MAG: UPF0175 family protein [Chloroflexota bacterium]